MARVIDHAVSVEDSLANLRTEVEDHLAAPRGADEWTDGWNAARLAVLDLISLAEAAK